LEFCNGIIKAKATALDLSSHP